MNPALLPWFSAGTVVIGGILTALRGDHSFPGYLSPSMRYLLATILGGVQTILMAARQGVGLNEALATSAATVLLACVVGAPRQIAEEGKP